MVQKFVLSAIAALAITGCATTSTGPVVVTDGTAANQIMRTSTTELTHDDIRSMTGEILDRIYSDDVFVSRVKLEGFKLGDTPMAPFAVRSVNNFTSSDTISGQKFLNLVEESLIGTGLVDVYTADSPDWYFAIDAELSSTRQIGDRGSAQTIFTLLLTISTVENKIIGKWTADKILTR